jgi:hypothetical protein
VLCVVYRLTELRVTLQSCQAQRLCGIVRDPRALERHGERGGVCLLLTRFRVRGSAIRFQSLNSRETRAPGGRGELSDLAVRRGRRVFVDFVFAFEVARGRRGV